MHVGQWVLPGVFAGLLTDVVAIVLVPQVLSATGTTYALKVVRLQGAAKDMVAGFLEEAQQLQKLQGSSNIIGLLNSQVGALRLLHAVVLVVLMSAAFSHQYSTCSANAL